MKFPKPTPQPKVARVRAQTRERAARRRKNIRTEQGAKAVVRARDVRCRFPLCRCHERGLALEVAHFRHKSMGGNPTMDRTTPDIMILVCSLRHQHGLWSMHRRTIFPWALTPDGFDGPVAWFVHKNDDVGWWCVWIESEPGVGREVSYQARFFLQGIAEAI